jgi:two-component system, chemotaxis family, chemotaxis protein CheY
MADAYLCGLANDGGLASPFPNGRLLVVDDNATIRSTLGRLARGWGYACGAAPDGEAAWRCLQCQRVSLVLTDHDMPRLDGLGLLRRLAAVTAATGRPLVPLILMSGNMSPSLADQAMAAGARAVLWKPLQPEVLRATIAALMLR